MKKYKKNKFFRCISIILILVLILSNTVFAKDYGSSKKNLDHIDVYVEGTISVETQINGVSQGKQTGTIIVSNISATIVDDGETRTYTNFSTQTQIGSGEMEFRKNVTKFSSSAVITISGTMVCEKLNINTTFSKTLSEDDVTAAILECPTHGGCDIRITANEVANIVTHNVVFKTEEGGKIDGDTANISYINVIDGTTFPDIPKTTPNDNYEFIGWYDESGNPVTEFPSAVKQDWVFIAKWKEIPKPTATATPKPTATATPEPTATATPKPTATATPEPTATATPEPTATATPEPTATATPKLTATATPKPTATATPEPTATPKPTVTATPEPTATATPEPTATATPEPTATATPEPTEIPTPTLIPEEVTASTPTKTPEPTNGSTATPEPTNRPTAKPEPTKRATPAPTKKPDLNQSTSVTVIPGNQSKQQITNYVPRTGDNRNFNGYNCSIMGMINSGIGISVTLLINKKKKKELR